MSPSYWARHMRETVRFGAGLTELAQKRGLVLLEVGPGHVLSTLARGSGVERERVVPTFGFTASPRRERRTVLESLGQLWLRGIDVDWTPLHESREPRRVPLPTYAFERKRYWLERRGTVPRSAAERVSGPSMEPIHAAAEEPARPAAHVRPELSTPYVSPSNEIEENLVLIWQRFLGIEGIGTRDNFFELGGDSLIATRLHAQIHAELGVELPMGKMYELATVRRIYLFIVMTRDPEAAETLSEDELDDFLAVMES